MLPCWSARGAIQHTCERAAGGKHDAIEHEIGHVAVKRRWARERPRPRGQARGRAGQSTNENAPTSSAPNDDEEYCIAARRRGVSAIPGQSASRAGDARCAAASAGTDRAAEARRRRRFKRESAASGAAEHVIAPPGESPRTPPRVPARSEMARRRSRRTGPRARPSDRASRPAPRRSARARAASRLAEEDRAEHLDEAGECETASERQRGRGEGGQQPGPAGLRPPRCGAVRGRSGTR